jgi:signal transduction histidine kinase
LEYLGIALDSCQQLRVCINDLLDASRIETGKLALDLKHASLAAVVKRVVTTMRPAADEKQIALVQEIPAELPDASLDQNRMTQVISNLLDNAIRHTPRGGSIVVKASPAQMRESLQVSVSDTGCGIPEEEQAHVFDRLYQIKAGDAASEQRLGLGLYLCRELVQLHGGRIWVESQPGRGCTFSFILPQHQPLTAAVSAPESVTDTPAWERNRDSFAHALVQ